MTGRKVPFSSKLAFGVGQAGEGLKNGSFNLFLLFYYNQVLGVPGWMCGTALGIALIFDAITDPLAGSLSDNWQGRLGRRHPFMYGSAIPLGICIYGLFSPPALSEWGLFAWLLGFAVLTRGAMTLYHVPHLALGAELTTDFEERTSIVAYRQAFGYLGAVTATAIGLGWFLRDSAGGRMNVDGYSPLALLVGVLIVVTVWYSAWGTQKEIPHLPQAPATRTGNALGRLLSELGSAFTNVSFRWLFAGVLIVFLMVGVDVALNLHMYEFFWELDGAAIFLLAAVTPAGLLLGTFFTRHLHRLFDKKPGLVFGTAGWAFCQIVPVVLRLVDWFPENGHPALVPTLIGFKFVQGLIVQQALVSFGSMMADVADEHELESGKRQEGIFFGAVSFSGKGASGLGNIVAGFGLTLIGWPRGPEIRSAADVPPETLMWLGLLYGPIVAGLAVVSVWCYSNYKLNRARHQEILDELAARRARSGTPVRPTELATGGAG